jgi:hypothetical protein
MPFALLYSYSLVLVPRHGSTDGMHSAAQISVKFLAVEPCVMSFSS